MDWNEVLTTLITMIVIPGLIYIGSKINKLIETNIKDKNFQKYLIIANDCITDAVADVAQTVVDKVKNEKDWDEIAKLEVFELAKYKAIQHLGITGKTLLEEALGDYDGWINSKIEAEVKRLAVKESSI